MRSQKKTNKGFLTSIVLSFAILTAGCGPYLVGTPHENFVSILRSEVGKNADSPNSWRRYHEDLMATRKLENGNIEEEYLLNKNCRYFFEINSKTRSIVGTRFKGGDQDCAIVP